MSTAHQVPTHHEDDFSAQLRDSSREVVDRPNYTARRVGAGLIAAGVVTGGIAGGAAVVDAFKGPEATVVSEDLRPIEQQQIIEAMDAAYDPSLRVGDPIVVEAGQTRLYGEAVARISNQPGYAENESTILDVIRESTLGIGVYQAGEVYSVYPVDLNGDGKLEYIVQEDKDQLGTLASTDK